MAPPKGNDLQPGAQQLNITNCVTQSFYQDGNNTLLVNFNPRFYNIINPAGADQKWFTADDGLQLTAPCSPGLNAGDNPAIAGIPTDLLGRTRIFNGGTVDLGPYELQSTPGTPVTTVYVNNTVATNATAAAGKRRSTPCNRLCCIVPTRSKSPPGSTPSPILQPTASSRSRTKK